MEKAALYLRLSKEDNDKEFDQYSNSIENQKAILTEYASVHDYEIYDIYVDDDFSGLFWNRPSFLRLLEDMKNKKFSIVIAKSQSRLSRNKEHVEYLLSDLFAEYNVRFIGVVDGVDTSFHSSKKARQINALINEWYSEDLSENIRAVYLRKMTAGDYLGAYAPFGYKKSCLDKYKLVVDEDEAIWVKRIFEWYMNGESVNGIIERLARMKVATPLEFRRGIKNSQTRWSKSTVKKILSNEMYTGKVIQGKSMRRSFKDKTIVYKDRTEWIIVDDMHEAIISEEIFQIVKLIRERR